jgi:prephenate dehydrogenase
VKVSIIGGYGRMGRWFTRYFSAQGHRVVITGPKLHKMKVFAEAAGAGFAENNIEAVKDADLSLVSVPIPITAKVIRTVAPHAKKGAVIAEISSLKADILKALIEAARFGIKPLSLHPLFGPGATKMSGQRIVVVPVVDRDAEVKLAEKLFPEAEVIFVDAEKHDRSMALVLSLPYFINMVFASVVGEENLEAMKKLAGTAFPLQLTLAESVMTEDSALHIAIQMDNKYTIPCLEKFLSQAKTIEKLITEKDKAKFTSICNNIRDLLSKDPDALKAYKRLYRILETLQ